MKVQNQERKGIKSIEIGCGILETIASYGQPLSISEISRVCDMSPSKVHHYLVSFCRVGFLDKAIDGKYSISTKLTLLSLAKENHTMIKKVLKPHLEDFCKALNETVALSFWREGGPYVALQEKSDKSINLTIREGSMMSVTSSANGKLFAALYPRSKTQPLIEKELSEQGINKDEFANELSRIRKDGYVVQNYPSGISCFAVPIYDKDRLMVGALSTIGIAGMMDLSPNSWITLNTINKGKELSTVLGSPI